MSRLSNPATTFGRFRVDRLEDRLTPAVLLANFTESVVAAGFTNATATEIAPNGDLWVLEQAGAVKRYAVGSTTPDVVIDLGLSGDLIAGERGLLGITFAPDFATSKDVYLYHTAQSGGTLFNRVSRYTVNDANPADYSAANERVVVDLDPLSATNHNGGAIHFGPDGKLYVATGENAVPANSQSISNRLGKILRYNADGSIPADNPTSIAGIAGTTTGANRAIWAAGLRNPYTFTFQPGTGRMFINDVGGNNFEEINEGGAGRNYGWIATEGDFDQASFPDFTRPVYAYSHGAGTFQGFAITGGAFYNPGVVTFPPEYTGDYFFSDFTGGWIHVRDAQTGAVTEFATGIGAPIDLKVLADGSLLYLARNTNQVFRVVNAAYVPPAPNPPPLPSPITPTTTALSAYSAGGLVRVLNADGSTRFDLAPYGLGFPAGISVATGDVTGDGVEDIITGAGAGASHVKVFDGRTGAEIYSFFAYGDFPGGVSVAAGDVLGTGRAQIITGAGAGGGPHVKVFDLSGGTPAEARSFFAYDPAFTGGVNVGAGRLDNRGRDLIVTGTGAGGLAIVEAFDAGLTPRLERSFFAADASFVGGINVAASGGLIAVGYGAGQGSLAQTYRYDDTSLAGTVSPFGAFAGGTRVAFADRDGDGSADLVVAAGPGGSPLVRTLRRADFGDLAVEFAFGPLFTGGVFVG